jgi:hypothetical protein
MAVVTPGTYSMAALMSEVNNDPKGLGYAAQAGNADSIAVLMNTSPEPIATNQQEQVYRTRTPSSDLIAGILLSDWTNASISAAHRDYCIMLFSAGFVNTGDANVRTQLGNIFGAATTSRANLIAAAQKNAARAEALWGDGFRVTGQQVSEALGQ